MRPTAAGRSLTVLHLLYDEPCWYPMVAPILRWACEVWYRQTRATDYCFSWAELRSSWAVVFSGDTPRWGQVRGPLGAMAASLLRLGWHMPDFVSLQTDMGDTILLTSTSPSLLKRLLREGVKRHFERELASKMEVPGRICVDYVRKQLRSSKVSPKAKGIIKLIACGGAWTKCRAADCGYELASVLCELCGLFKDTLRHRLWQCPVVRDARAEIATEAIIEDALKEDYSPQHVALFERALLPHPGDRFPRPLGEGGVVYQWQAEDADQEQRFYAGQVFIDGSCYRHAVPELSRAGWGVAVYNNSGELILKAFGPVWAPSPQTSQAGEWTGYALAGQSLNAHSDLYSDCSNVVDTHCRSVAVRLASTRQYAGASLSVLAAGFIRSCVKVKAHLDPNAEDISEYEKFVRIGNCTADEAAKEGASSHPAPDPADVQLLAYQAKVAGTVCRLAASLLPYWPKLNLEGVGRASKPRDAPSTMAKPGHSWAFLSHFWRCTKCNRACRLQVRGSRPPPGECSGGSGLDVGKMREHLHNIVGLSCSDGAMLFGCHRCRRYTSHGHGKRITHEFCDFRSTPARDFAWRSICNGVHPLFPEVRVDNIDLLRWPAEDVSQLSASCVQVVAGLRDSDAHA